MEKEKLQANLVVYLGAFTHNVFFNSRGKVMAFFRSFFVVVVLSFSHCFSIDKTPLIEAIERQDIAEIVNFFEKIGTVSREEAHKLITDFYEHYTMQFGGEILDNEEFIKNLENWKEIYHSILEGGGISFENSLILNNGYVSPSIVLCGKRKNKKIEAEIPGSMIIGGVEILGGALVWILPIPGSKVVGGAMMSDGVRRTFNGLEELDEVNKRNGEFPSSAPPS